LQRKTSKIVYTVAQKQLVLEAIKQKILRPPSTIFIGGQGTTMHAFDALVGSMTEAAAERCRRKIRDAIFDLVCYFFL